MATAYLLACLLTFLQGISVVVSVFWSGASAQPTGRGRIALGGLALTTTLGAYPLIYSASKVLAYGPADVAGLLALTLAFTVVHGVYAIRKTRAAKKETAQPSPTVGKVGG